MVEFRYESLITVVQRPERHTQTAFQAQPPILQLLLPRCDITFYSIVLIVGWYNGTLLNRHVEVDASGEVF